MRKLQKCLMAALFLLAAGLFVKPVETSAATFGENEYRILGNIIGGVESGGQVYGNKNYSAYAGPYENSDKEVTCTLGWPQYYGNEGRNLINRIYQKNPANFKSIDRTGSIQSRLGRDWEADRWSPNEADKNILIQLISTNEGHAAQDELYSTLMSGMVRDCQNTYTTDIRAVMMYCEIRHLGGLGPVNRIFRRCNGNYSVDNIMASLKQDENDRSNNNQVGDRKFWSRHEKCSAWVKQYVGTSGQPQANITFPTSNRSDAVFMLRFYNPNSGEHFYTSNHTEGSVLVKAGWRYEGVGWTAPLAGDPVYRLYNPNAGDHHYTISASERDNLIGYGWRYEGIGWRTAPHTGIPLYRAYNPNARAGAHHFTTSQSEIRMLVGVGWRAEGVAWYGV